MTSKHSQIIRTCFLPDQNPPRTHKTSKSSKFDSHRLAVVHRQVVHQNP